MRSSTRWGFMQTNSPAKTLRVYKLEVYGSNDSQFPLNILKYQKLKFFEFK
jgi:hypothetical protein